MSEVLISFAFLAQPSKFIHTGYHSPSCPSHARPGSDTGRKKHVIDRRESPKGLQWRPSIVGVWDRAPRRTSILIGPIQSLADRSSKILPPLASGLCTVRHCCQQSQTQPHANASWAVPRDDLISIVSISNSLKGTIFLRQYIFKRLVALTLQPLTGVSQNNCFSHLPKN